jgi:hypothetical protein
MPQERTNAVLFRDPKLMSEIDYDYLYSTFWSEGVSNF